MVLGPVRLEKHSRGGLLVWAHPEPDRDYIVASDTAGGGAHGDFSVAVVLEAEKCDLVAAWRERADSHIWGQKCARLASYYNTAMLAFETQPSTHGLAAAESAINFGYTRMYRNRRQDTYTKVWTESIGFHTHAGTKPLIIDRIKMQRDAGSVIPWEDLLYELKQQQWDDRTATNVPKMVSKGHDDCVMAYGIALRVRDDCYRRKLIKEESHEPTTATEHFWARRDRMFAQPQRKPRKPEWRPA